MSSEKRTEPVFSEIKDLINFDNIIGEVNATSISDGFDSQEFMITAIDNANFDLRLVEIIFLLLNLLLNNLG